MPPFTRRKKPLGLNEQTRSGRCATGLLERLGHNFSTNELYQSEILQVSRYSGIITPAKSSRLAILKFPLTASVGIHPGSCRR